LLGARGEDSGSPGDHVHTAYGASYHP
jgi:hypothetical protein